VERRTIFLSGHPVRRTAEKTGTHSRRIHHSRLFGDRIEKHYSLFLNGRIDRRNPVGVGKRIKIQV
jgi:hypothetical protein